MRDESSDTVRQGRKLSVPISSRQRDLLLMLLTTDGWLSARTASDELACSAHSLYQDVHDMRRMLRDWGLHIEESRRQGIRLLGDRESLDWLRGALGREEIGPIIYVPRDRRRLIGKMILSADGIDFGTCCDFFHVSKRTLHYDLAEIERRSLMPLGITLRRDRSRGVVSMDGGETACREGAYRIACSSMDPGEWLDSLTAVAQSSSLDHLMSDPRSAELRRMFTLTAGHPHSRALFAVLSAPELGYLSSLSLSELCIHTVIALDRIRQGHRLQDEAVARWVAGSFEARTAEAVLGRLADTLGTSLPEGETEYFALRLMAAEAESRSRSCVCRGGRVDGTAPSLARSLLAGILTEAPSGWDAGKDLIEDLGSQLRSALTRSRFNFTTVVPSFPEVRRRYPDLFSRVSRAVAHAESRIGTPLGQAGIERLTALLAERLERAGGSRSRQIRSAVVCPCGMAWSSLMVTRLRREFPLVDFGVVPIKDLWQGSTRNWDLIVSTVPLPSPSRALAAQIPVVLVSPLLDPADVKRVSCALSEIEATPSETEVHGSGTGHATTSLPRLRDLIDASMVSVDSAVDDPEQAIQESGSLLVRNNHVKWDYVEAMKQVYRLYGPYMVILPGVAMPHAPPKSGVISPGISCLKLRYPIPFGHESNQEVDLVFGLATTDDVSLSSAILDLLDVLRDPSNLSLLRSSNTPEEVVRVLTSTRPT